MFEARLDATFREEAVAQRRIAEAQHLQGAAGAEALVHHGPHLGHPADAHEGLHEVPAVYDRAGAEHGALYHLATPRTASAGNRVKWPWARRRGTLGGSTEPSMPFLTAALSLAFAGTSVFAARSLAGTPVLVADGGPPQAVVAADSAFTSCIVRMREFERAGFDLVWVATDASADSALLRLRAHHAGLVSRVVADPDGQLARRLQLLPAAPRQRASGGPQGRREHAAPRRGGRPTPAAPPERRAPRGAPAPWACAARPPG